MTVSDLIKLLEAHAEDDSEVNVNGAPVDEIHFVFTEQSKGSECAEVNIC